ncbi:MAG: DUF1080 domain-containing protein [Bacteroidota bacterium]
MKKYICIFTLLILFTALASAQEYNKLSKKKIKQGWSLLFDGKSTTGWTTVDGKPVPDGWKVENGMLTAVRDGKGGDIVTVKEYDSFELTLDYNINIESNSGVKYLFANYESGGNLGMEFQILDDELAEDNQKANHLAGSLYDILAPSKVMKKVNPPGQWNSIRILVEGDKVQHFLNGFKIVEYDRKSKAFADAVALSKFSKTTPAFGTVKKGRILLQEHGGVVSFRDIKIRPIRL